MERSFFNSVGKAGIGSRLRFLQEKVNEDAANIYKLFNIDMQPKWFPVFYMLRTGSLTITEIAQHIGHSHPSVSKIVAEMVNAGLVTESRVATDGRRNMLSLSDLGREIDAKLTYQLEDVKSAIEGMLGTTRHNLWEAIEEWEALLEQKSLFERVREEKELREQQEVRIVDYELRYNEAFRSLNAEWITTYFQMEEADYKALDNPETYILDKGGKILVALYNNEPVGVCALIKMDDPDYDYELAKMAVSPRAQGKKIGWLLGRAALSTAADLGASKVYLESNTALKPAINLYRKLGFREVIGRATPYARCNIQMEIFLDAG
jgi:DNA-binding MarR family transcriptional regulator/GNAT superfamily N-acetyltransferase